MHFVAALKPIYEATIKSQVTQLTRRYFFLLWFECQHEINELPEHNPFKEVLKEKKENRKTFFFEKDVFCATIFLGSKLISESLKLIAIAHLEKTYNLLNSMIVRSTGNDSLIHDSSPDTQSSPSISFQISDEPVPPPRGKMETILELPYPDPHLHFFYYQYLHWLIPVLMHRFLRY